MLIVVSQNVTLQFAWGQVAESVPSPSMLVPESTHMYPTNLSQGGRDNPGTDHSLCRVVESVPRSKK